jgi:hypothetical protein
MTFDKFINAFNSINQVMAENGEERMEESKIDKMLRKIECQHIDVQAAISVIRNDPVQMRDWHSMVNKLSKTISIAFPNSKNPNRDGG